MICHLTYDRSIMKKTFKNIDLAVFDIKTRLAVRVWLPLLTGCTESSDKNELINFNKLGKNAI